MRTFYLFQFIQFTSSQDQSTNIILVDVFNVAGDHAWFQTDNIILQTFTDIFHGQLAETRREIQLGLRSNNKNDLSVCRSLTFVSVGGLFENGDRSSMDPCAGGTNEEEIEEVRG